jgi:hypothetical protein
LLVNIGQKLLPGDILFRLTRASGRAYHTPESFSSQKTCEEARGMTDPLRKEFTNPGKDYRSVPFWSWNDRLQAGELRRQVRDM